MRKAESDHLAVVLLGLGCAVVVGMLLSTWELVLYPSLLLMGVLLAMALIRRGASLAIGLPVGIVALLVALFAALHAMGVDSPSGQGSFLGWDPLTALYLFGMGPAFLLVGLLYALTDRDDTAPADEELTR